MRQQGFRKLLLTLFAVSVLLFAMPCPLGFAEESPQDFTITAPILSDADDMEERLTDGSLHFDSTHLELGCAHPDSIDSSEPQLVILRFDTLQIPPNAQITNAYIQFTAYSTHSSPNPFQLTIAMEDTVNSAPLPAQTDIDSNHAISSRSTIGEVLWQSDLENPLLWQTDNRAGDAQCTPNLSELVQNMVQRDGWEYDNAMAFLLQGSGGRIAYSHDNDAAKAPVLIVSYTAPVLPQAPPSALYATAPTDTNDRDGRIIGTTEAMEYRLTGTEPWKPCPADAITGLSAGEYEVRYAQKPGYTPSAPAIVSVYEFILDVTLQPGADETQMNFNWFCKHRQDNQTILQLALQANMTADTFPAYAAQTFYGEHCTSDGYMANWATAAGLKPNTDYVYRFSTGFGYSQTYRFSTHSTDAFNFIFAGDPQIGSSGYRLQDAADWNTMLETALAASPETSFILSAGDQIEYEGQQVLYEYFFSPKILTSMPIAPTIGNHDMWYFYQDHFNVPNESTSYGQSIAGGDYWFTYGKTLFIDINTNVFDAKSHDAFINDAITAAGDDIRWKILVFHHSIYSAGAHSKENFVVEWRASLAPIIDKYQFDVVLTGHDHCYTRSFQMLAGEPVGKAESIVINPIGTVYFTAGSSSGSKHYKLRRTIPDYAAVYWQGYEATYANVEITDTQFTITTYTVADHTIIDQYTIIKDIP